MPALLRCPIGNCETETTVRACVQRLLRATPRLALLLLLCALCAGCDAQRSSADAQTNSTYLFDLVVGTQEAGTLFEGTIIIDGEQTQRARRVFDDFEQARTSQLRIEFWQQGQKLTEQLISPTRCDDRFGTSAPGTRFERRELCIYYSCPTYWIANEGDSCTYSPELPPDVPLCLAVFDRCNPVTNIGCGPGQKCAIDVGPGLVDCVAEAKQPIEPGRACVQDSSPGFSIDNCRGGSVCLESICRKLCDEPSDCATGVCVVQPGMFECAAQTGVCEL